MCATTTPTGRSRSAVHPHKGDLLQFPLHAQPLPEEGHDGGGERDEQPPLHVEGEAVRRGAHQEMQHEQGQREIEALLGPLHLRQAAQKKTVQTAQTAPIWGEGERRKTIPTWCHKNNQRCPRETGRCEGLMAIQGERTGNCLKTEIFFDSASDFVSHEKMFLQGKIWK